MTQTVQSIRKTRDRNWWSWSNTVVVVLLLTGTIVSFTLPTLLHDPSLSQLKVGLAVRGLVGLVLLFNAYSLLQQFLIKDLSANVQQEHAFSNILFRKYTIDAPTGIWSRDYSEKCIEMEIDRCHKENTTLTLALFDLDQFKQINDTYGHLAGDSVLLAFAEHLTRHIDSCDLVARVGGDEFMLVFLGRTAYQVQPILQRVVHFAVNIAGKKIPMRASAGWKEYEQGQTFTELVDSADRALYENKRIKRTSRNRLYRSS